MQAELRLSAGEHSFLATYRVFTYGGSSLERATSRNLAAGPLNYRDAVLPEQVITC